MGLFLLGRVLEWFKPYFTKIQENGLTTINYKVRYMFLLQEGFCKRMIQIFSSPKEELIAKDKLEIIQQTLSAIAYSTEFQM